MKKIAFYTALLISIHLQGQDLYQDDTILIREVVISMKTSNPPPGFKITRLDSVFLTDYNHRTLADLLSENSSLFVKSYGPGGIATPSFRGTGPGHTQISWNNINLNNPMLGQFDMSLVPAGFADNVVISYGGGSMGINNGGIGGIINIETKPDWNHEKILIVNPGFGSFGRYSGLVKVRTGNAAFQSVTKAFLTTAENNFRYLNNIQGGEPVWERRDNSQVSQKGFIEELYFKGNNRIVSTRFWYQSTSRNLPVPLSMLSMDQGEKQNDESLRSLFTYETLNDRTNYNVSAAFVSDRLNYSNQLARINSRNISRSLILKADAETEINEMIRLKVNLNNELNFINSNNYQGGKTRNIASLGASLETGLTNWLSGRMLVRETLQDNKFMIPDFSFGTEIRLFPEKGNFLKANFSRNSKIPTLNDMYWMPGGNPDLKNETGYIAEIGWEITDLQLSPLEIKSELTAFRNVISDMIQWYPGENTYWVAGNVNKITTAGIESEISLTYYRSNLKWFAHFVYTMTKATSAGLTANAEGLGNNQLIYIPVNRLNSLLRLNWHYFSSSVKVNYTGRRYLTADNSRYLPGYTVCDLNLGVRLNFKNTAYDIGVTVDNVFNISYQDIAWYPMPGRGYMFSLIFQLK